MSKEFKIGALELEQLEKFYRASYETGGKDIISDDYEYCVWLLADEDCELVPRIKLSDLENLKEATQEDADKFDKSFNEFKKVHKFAEREQAMKELLYIKDLQYMIMLLILIPKTSL